MGKTGGPEFPITTNNELALQFMNQGVGQLHGFWFWEAERSFRQVALLDPDCAMAYWGMAMANKNNAGRAKGFIRHAIKLKDKSSAREQLYLTVLSEFYDSLDKEEQEEKTKAEAKEKEKQAQEQAVKKAAEEKAAADKAAEDKALAEQAAADKAAVERGSSENPQPKEEANEELRKQNEELKKQAEEQRKQAEAAKKKEQDAERREQERLKKEAKKVRHQARIHAWEKLTEDYPDDSHALAFLILTLWEDRDIVPLGSVKAVDALLTQLLSKHPHHPAHHYRIHLWDDVRASKAIASAAQCGPAAPAIAHMWHMPGHTYVKLKRFHDAAYQQEASARVDHAYMQRDMIIPYQIHNYGHNNEWCVRNLLTIGRADDAIRLAKNLIEIPRHPKHNEFKAEGDGPANWGRDRLWETLIRFELWPETIALAESPYLREPNESETAEIRRRRYLGTAHLALGHEAQANEQLAWLDKRAAELREQKEALPSDGEKKSTDGDAKPDMACTPPSPLPKEKSAATSSEPQLAPKSDINRTNKQIDDLANRVQEAIAHIRAVQAERAGDFAAALEHAKKADNLPKEQLARFHLAAGDKEQALKLAREAANSSERSLLARAALVSAQWAAGEREKAEKEFDQLRQFAVTADLQLPALERLRPIARELGYPDDWRTALPPAGDLGERPPLDSLGPLTWSPWRAEPWTLPDHNGQQIALDERYRGKPVVVLFYLGFGCLHCIEQLNTFGPLAKEYEAAGIQLVAISTDSPEKLQKTFEQAKQEGGFPFPILANSDLAVFQKYRCYDDFERRPLHGTFLIDAAGKVRWQEIGPEPFSDAKFLLEESRRLLSLPAAGG